METRNIVVIGASAGGFDVLKKLAADLPEDLDASLFIVWHMSPNIEGVLPRVLNKAGLIPAATPLIKKRLRQTESMSRRPTIICFLNAGEFA